MSLLAEARTETTQPGPRCTVAAVRARLTPGEAAELDTALADPDAAGVTIAGLARALRKRGHQMAPSTLGRHQRGECRCSA